MAVFSNNAVTDKGRILLAESQVGALFVPTKIVMGSGTMPSGSTPRSMTAVATPVVQLSINKKRASDDGKVIIGGMYSNTSITEAFYFRELGLYAQLQLADGSFSEEVLYAYANAGSSADLMAAASSAVIEKQIDLVTYIGSDTQIDLTIESGAYIPFTDKGAPSGVATLGDDGKVPAAQLPAMDFDPAGSAAAVQTALSGHTGDNVRHLTAAERTAWNAKAAGDHTHTAAQVGAVPTTRKVNGKALSADVTLTAADVGAAAASHSHGAGDIASGTLDAARIPDLAASKITSGTLPVARGGTGAASLTSGNALIGAGTGAVTTRAIKDNTSASAALTASSALVTMNTLRYALNRTTGPGAADTNYTTFMVRAEALYSSDTTPSKNGQISWTYE